MVSYGDSPSCGVTMTTRSLRRARFLGVVARAGRLLGLLPDPPHNLANIQNGSIMNSQQAAMNALSNVLIVPSPGVPHPPRLPPFATPYGPRRRGPQGATLRVPRRRYIQPETEEDVNTLGANNYGKVRARAGATLPRISRPLPRISPPLSKGRPPRLLGRSGLF